jgi:hypothetical protein
MVIGRYKNASDLKNATITLRGKSGRESRSFNYSNLDFSVREEDNDFLRGCGRAGESDGLSSRSA